MATQKVASTGPLSSGDIQQRLEVSRRLLSLAAHQHVQAKLNLDEAALALAELETDLAMRGIGGSQ